MSLLVVTGPPGSGKSTVAASVADRPARSVLVDGDAFFAFLRRGAIEPWLAESHAQNEVVIAAAAVATGWFARHYATVYDGVVGPWFVDAFLRGTGLGELDYVVLLPDVEVCVDRVMTRTGHGFRDEPAARKMHAEFVRAAVEDRHVVVNDGAVDATVDEIVARRDRGALRLAAQ